MISKIGIIGGGKMGKDLFYFLSDFSFELCWVHRTEAGMKEGKRTWMKRQERTRKYKKEEDRSILENPDRYKITCDLNELKNCDLIIESINEDISLKKNLFNQLDRVVNANAIFSTNTSSIPIRDLVPSAARADRFIGLHFFYPVKLKNLSELNALSSTADWVKDEAVQFLDHIRKFHVVFDEPDHFLFNRLFLKLQAGVYNLHVEENIPVHVLDELIRKNLFPTGVFQFFDKVGIDVMYSSVRNYVNSLADKEYYLPLLEGLKKMKDQNYLGVKTGRGFYQYTPEEDHYGNLPHPFTIEEEEKIVRRLYDWYLAPLREAISKGVLTSQQVDFIAKEYHDTDKGPVELSAALGTQL